jgi:pilus assembly protein Flp/PilA
MSKLMSSVKSFIADENGVTAIEYGLLAAVVGLALATTAGLLADDIKSVFTKIGTELKAAVGT